MALTEHPYHSGDRTSHAGQTAVANRAQPSTVQPGEAASGRANNADLGQTPVIAPGDGHIGRIVAGSLIAGLVTAVALVAVPLAGAPEHVITGSVLLAFAGAWATLAALSQRARQPQRWAIGPAVAMALAGTSILAFAPTGNELGWVWPPALAALVAWMVIGVRRDLTSRTRIWIVYPVFAALLVAAAGGGYQTFRESVPTGIPPMAGRLIDVGGHRLHLDCRGSGSPTVVLEPGLGEPSPNMAGWIAPGVAATTRVCVYDRAGRGWSEAASGPQDGVQVATDLHTLLQRAGESGPYVLAGHSAGGLYVLNFANRYPQQVAGVVLLDSMHPDQYTRLASYPGFYETFRRVTALLPSLSRLGLGQLLYRTAYAGLPNPARDEERAFWATPRHSRSVRDEFAELRTAMTQARSLASLGNRPLVVVTAQQGAQTGWMALQDELASLSTNSAHRILVGSTHTMLTEHKGTAAQSSRAIRDVVDSVRNGTQVPKP
jgi:pimeloyl-ACP methyl ester carboxylesterase